MSRLPSYEHLSDIGKGLQLCGVAITGLITAAGFVESKINRRTQRTQARYANPTQRSDHTVVDLPHKTAN